MDGDGHDDEHVANIGLVNDDGFTDRSGSDVAPPRGWLNPHGSQITS